MGVPSENHFNRIRNQLDPDLANLIRKFMQIGEYRIRDELKKKKINNESSKISLYVAWMNYSIISINLAIDLLEKMLQMNPSRRITCTDALNHSLFNHLNQLYGPNEDEDNIKEPSNFNDINDLTVEEWKSK